jgi:hypothetical protein
MGSRRAPAVVPDHRGLRLSGQCDALPASWLFLHGRPGQLADEDSLMGRQDGVNWARPCELQLPLAAAWLLRPRRKKPPANVALGRQRVS